MRYVGNYRCVFKQYSDRVVVEKVDAVLGEWERDVSECVCDFYVEARVCRFELVIFVTVTFLLTAGRPVHVLAKIKLLRERVSRGTSFLILKDKCISRNIKLNVLLNEKIALFSTALIDVPVIFVENDDHLVMHVVKEFPVCVPAEDVLVDFDSRRNYHETRVYDVDLKELQHAFI